MLQHSSDVERWNRVYFFDLDDYNHIQTFEDEKWKHFGIWAPYGVNFTDGLDWLASSVTILGATFFSVVAVVNACGIAPGTCAVVGALLGFLLFNVYPASVFMGDTGSLALGGFVAATAYMLQMQFSF